MPVATGEPATLFVIVPVPTRMDAVSGRFAAGAQISPWVAPSADDVELTFVAHEFLANRNVCTWGRLLGTRHGSARCTDTRCRFALCPV